MELTTLVFEQAGKHNTDATLQIAKKRALALGIKQVVVASSHGYTARQAHALFAPAGIKVIAVSICHGWESKGWTMSAETKAERQPPRAPSSALTVERHLRVPSSVPTVVRK